MIKHLKAIAALALLAGAFTLYYRYPVLLPWTFGASAAVVIYGLAYAMVNGDQTSDTRGV